MTLTFSALLGGGALFFRMLLTTPATMSEKRRMVTQTIKESPVLGGGAALPSEPPSTGDFALPRSERSGLSLSVPQAKHLARGDFPKTERQHGRPVPGVSYPCASPKGLGRPVNKPLMRTPRAPCLSASPIGLLPGTFSGLPTKAGAGEQRRSVDGTRWVKLRTARAKPVARRSRTFGGIEKLPACGYVGGESLLIGLIIRTCVKSQNRL
jgi:hypothetical protein